MTPIAAPRRVVVIRPDHLGDVVLSGPTVARLRRGWPAAEIALLVGPWGAEAARRLPGADRVAELDFPYFDRAARPGWRQPRRAAAARLAPWRRLAAAARALRAARYDVAVIARDDDRWGALLARAAGIPVVAGHATPRTRAVLTHRLPAAARPAHVAAAGVALAAALAGDGDAGRGGGGRRAGGPPGDRAARPTPASDPLALCLTDADRAAAATLLAPLAGAAAPIALHAGAGSPIKRWPAARWAAALRAVTAEGEAVVLTGGPGEAGLAADAAAELAAAGRAALDLSGRTDLGALAAVYARCRLVVGPDSGPLHLAVAVGTPTLHLFGPADAARFGPWGSPARHAVVASGLVCAPCGRLDWPDPLDHPCVRAIEAGRVAAALAQLVRAGS